MSFMNSLSEEEVNIIAIPFAGGNAYCYKEIENHVKGNFKWVTLELPGRGSRFKEALLSDIREMVDDLYHSLILHVKKKSYVLYGHSMGTVIGYELVKKLIENDMPLPLCALFTGRGAPNTVMTKKRSAMPEKMFWEEVSSIGGLPKEILKNKELLDLYYPILRADFKAIETYQYTPLKEPFPIPIYICLGKDEIGEGEDRTSLKEIKDWNNETIYPCKPTFLEGDHFFILKHPGAVVQLLVNAFEKSKVKM